MSITVIQIKFIFSFGCFEFEKLSFNNENIMIKLFHFLFENVQISSQFTKPLNKTQIFWL